MLSLTVYGGTAGDDSSGEIGGNKILLEWGDRAFFLDFGTRFSVSGRFFEEFLKPRSGCGLRDYLRMGLLPPLEGLYRSDLFANEPDLWERYRRHPHYRRLDHVDGVLLSHGHVDHSGMLGFLRPEISVYTGLMTAVIGKGMQDCYPSSADRELCYIAPKEADGDVLRAARGSPRVGRPHLICESTPELVRAMEALRGFWSDVPGPRTNLLDAPLRAADLASHGIRFFRVDHSIPGSGAFAVETPSGWIAYSGDLRLHGHSKWRTEQFATAVAALNPSVLVVEGTHLQEEPATEEPEVHEAARNVANHENRLIIADFSPRNIERLRTFHDIAKEVGRRLVVTTRDAYLLEQMHVIDPNIPCPNQDEMAVLVEPVVQRPHWERHVLTTFAANLTDARAVRQEPGAFILCLSFFDITNLIDLEPEGGTYIYSSSEAYNEEQAIDQRRLSEWLRHFNLRPVGGLPGAEEGPFHASGHIDAAGMEWLISTINPERIVPVHTQRLDWFVQRWPDKVIEAAYGERVRLD
jgi:ribonuclease J